MSISRVHIVYVLLGVIIFVVTVFMVWMFFYDHSIFWTVFPEFIAGFLSGILGVALGFTINRMYESSQLQKRTKLALNSVLNELTINHWVVKTVKSNIKERKEWFRLFKTKAWDTLGAQLGSSKDPQLAFDLAQLYWELDSFNEAIKKAELVEDLNDFYSGYGYAGVEDFLDFLEEYINETMAKVAEVSAPEQKRRAKARLLFHFFGKRICNFRVIILACLFILILSILTCFTARIFPGFNQIFSASSRTPWGIVTSLFIHAGASHLTNNIGSLFVFLLCFIFTNLYYSETKITKRTFFASLLIFSSAIFSNLLWILLRPDVSVMGASGTVYALNGTTLGFALWNISEILEMSDTFEVEDIKNILESKSEEKKRKVLRRLRYVFLLTNVGVLVYFLILLFSSPQIFLNISPRVNSFIHALSFCISFVFTLGYTMKNWFIDRVLDRN